MSRLIAASIHPAMEGNSVNLKTYQAYSMSEALAAVKSDLGANAVILNTRTFKRGGVLGVGRRTIVEVTATPAAQQAAAARRSEQPPRLKVKAAVAQRAYLNKTDVNAGTASKTMGKSAIRGGAMMPRVPNRPTSAAVPTIDVEQEKRNTARLAVDLAERAIAARAPEKVAPPPSVIAVPPAPAARRFLLKSLEPATQRKGAITEPAGFTHNMQDELSAIKSMVGQVLHRQGVGSGQADPSMPKQLFDMYLKLIGQDISDELADQIVNAVRDELAPEELEHQQVLRSAVLRHLAEYIPVAQEVEPEQRSDGRPLTIALIGPTGVGKTTTLAKLAASFKLRHGKRVGLITSDTYRIAAVEQLRTYANIIGLPLQVALTPPEMRQATQTLSSSDVILIDTAGRSQNDSSRINELKEFVGAANPHEVHLVLASTAGEKVLLREAEAFAAVGVHKIVLTKLDEAVSFGMLVNVIRRVGKQLSFVTTGQEVPTHLETGRAERLAELVLGGKVRA